MNPDPTKPPPELPKSITGVTTISQIQRFPHGSGATNTLNTPPQRLKVEFIYKRDPRTTEKIYLKDPIVSVTAASVGDVPLLPDTKKETDGQGVADFGSLPAGNYLLTPDYTNLDKCKFDFKVKPQIIYLGPGEEKNVIFEVEPLYQKVQLIAHCLLAIPDRIYEPAGSDADKLVITESGGKKTFAYKSNRVSVGPHTIKDLKPPLPAEMGEIEADDSGIGTLTLKKKVLPDEYYTIDELPAGVKEKIKDVKLLPNPEEYEVKNKEGVTKSDIDRELGDKAIINPRMTKLTMRGSFTLTDLSASVKDTIDIGKRIIIPNTYEFAYKDKFAQKDLDLEGKAKFITTPPAGPPPALTPTSSGGPGGMPPPPPGSGLGGPPPPPGAGKGGPPPPPGSGSGGPVGSAPGKAYFTTEKKPPVIAFWRKDELDPKILDPEKIEVTEPRSSADPDVYAIKFKEKFVTQTFTTNDLKGEWKGKYHGLLNDKDDMDARINLVKLTLDHAYKKAKDDPTILKVFMVPECFFQGRYGAYRVEDADHLFTRLLNMVSDVIWRDWIFVFGTVNLTFSENSEGLPGTVEGIREMMNYSPVIRGGIESTGGFEGSGGQNDRNMRLVQKLVNSAELLDAGELIHHTKKKDKPVTPGEKKDAAAGGDEEEVNDEVREPAVNEAVQFQATQNEEKVRVILQDLLDRKPDFTRKDTKGFKDHDFGVRKGLDPKQWAELIAELELNVDEIGLTRVVRSIRICKISEVKKELSEWGPFNGYEDKTQANREPAGWVITMEEMVLKFIKEGWTRYQKQNSDLPAFTAELWQQPVDPGPARRKAILEDVQKNSNEWLKELGFTREYAKNAMSGKIAGLLASDAEAIKSGNPLMMKETVLKFIKDGWARYQKQNSGVPAFTSELWQQPADPGPARRKAILEDIQKNSNEWLKESGFTQEYAKEAMNNRIAALLGDDAEAIKSGKETGPPLMAPIPSKFGASIYPIWKKILELYREDQKELFTPLSGSMDYRDYCFAIRRKAGHWISMEKAASLEPCKKLIFGLEICADHAKGRLRNLVQEPISEFRPSVFKPVNLIEDDGNLSAAEIRRNQAYIAERREFHKNGLVKEKEQHKAKMEKIKETNKLRPNVTIDIQLIASAGMVPGDDAIVARKDGYCFNCDGWNKGSDVGVNFIEAWFEGPKYDTVNPVTPHTAIARGGGVALGMEAFKPERVDLKDVIKPPEQFEAILNKSGLGELHVYDPLDLPKP